MGRKSVRNSPPASKQDEEDLPNTQDSNNSKLFRRSLSVSRSQSKEEIENSISRDGGDESKEENARKWSHLTNVNFVVPMLLLLAAVTAAIIADRAGLAGILQTAKKENPSWRKESISMRKEQSSLYRFLNVRRWEEGPKLMIFVGPKEECNKALTTYGKMLGAERLNITHEDMKTKRDFSPHRTGPVLFTIPLKGADPIAADDFGHHLKTIMDTKQLGSSEWHFVFTITDAPRHEGPYTIQDAMRLNCFTSDRLYHIIRAVHM
eukprot:TRINITY_DN4626_c1_g1_i1.p1 TRINITY_DN4626_c1_g1~~TRINITY_DN4626_c1_g1_i1.p1  ORF type:complete len:278 (+),score=51.12 TRINITY_DN4626_c1_g1_i1:44-835(+)